MEDTIMQMLKEMLDKGQKPYDTLFSLELTILLIISSLRAARFPSGKLRILVIARYLRTTHSEAFPFLVAKSSLCLVPALCE